MPTIGHIAVYSNVACSFVVCEDGPIGRVDLRLTCASVKCVCMCVCVCTLESVTDVLVSTLLMSGEKFVAMVISPC